MPGITNEFESDNTLIKVLLVFQIVIIQLSFGILVGQLIFICKIKPYIYVRYVLPCAFVKEICFTTMKNKMLREIL